MNCVGGNQSIHQSINQGYDIIIRPSTTCWRDIFWIIIHRLISIPKHRIVSTILKKQLIWLRGEGPPPNQMYVQDSGKTYDKARPLITDQKSK
mmetsp:Transcript_31942/g.77682  ORF Transcript_31942/g.77682 Transcript_31942/m.77682 type:complete len:93 (+) Transcript_31942:988-1266(+)